MKYITITLLCIDLEIMSNNPYYNLSVDEQNIIIKIDKKAIDYQQLTQLLNHLELKSISQRSQLTEEVAAEDRE
jgi:hypothetical protein